MAAFQSRAVAAAIVYGSNVEGVPYKTVHVCAIRLNNCTIQAPINSIKRDSHFSPRSNHSPPLWVPTFRVRSVIENVFFHSNELAYCGFNVYVTCNSQVSIW